MGRCDPFEAAETEAALDRLAARTPRPARHAGEDKPAMNTDPVAIRREALALVLTHIQPNASWRAVLASAGLVARFLLAGDGGDNAGAVRPGPLPVDGGDDLGDQVEVVFPVTFDPGLQQEDVLHRSLNETLAGGMSTVHDIGSLVGGTFRVADAVESAGEQPAGSALPPAAARADRILGFDRDGAPTLRALGGGDRWPELEPPMDVDQPPRAPIGGAPAAAVPSAA